MRYVPVEAARRELGRLVREAATGEPVTIGRRGTEQAVLLGSDEYERLRRLEEQVAIERVEDALREIRAAVRKEKLPRSVVEDAIGWARRQR